MPIAILVGSRLRCNSDSRYQHNFKGEILVSIGKSSNGNHENVCRVLVYYDKQSPTGQRRSKEQIESQ